MTPYIALIQAFAFSGQPNGWAQCNGQLLPINQNQALFALLGTTYGGNGVNTFGLPNLRGRNPRHFGSGVLGQPPVSLGEVGGTETVTLLTNNLPAHTHNVSVGVNPAAGNVSNPTNRLANSPGTYKEGATANVFLGGVTQSNIGQSIPVNIRNPYTVVNMCIALVGIFPSRN